VTVYTAALPKGGSTKTTTAAELAHYLTQQGRRVLAIDLDQQGNLTTRLGITQDTEIGAATADVLMGEADADEAAVPAPTAPGVSVLVGTHDLSAVEATPPPDLVTSLRDHLPTVREHYDDVVIDTPPSLTGLTLAGLAAADVVIAPVSAAVESYDQVGRLAGVIAHTLEKRVRPGLRIHWIVPTRYDARRTLDREVLEMLTTTYPGQVTSPIREAVAVRDSYTAGQTISVYRPTSAVAQDYRTALASIYQTKKATR
jgi:chromosome partitioning protein